MTNELIGGLVILLMAIASAIFGSRKSSPAIDAQLEADKAKQEAITAKADLKKAEIKHDTEDALAAAAALSDADIIYNAIEEHRARNQERDRRNGKHWGVTE